jgi:hypothetical protein
VTDSPKTTNTYIEIPAAVFTSGEPKPEAITYDTAVVPPEDANDFRIGQIYLAQ